MNGLDYFQICQFSCETKYYLNVSTENNVTRTILKLRTGSHNLAVQTNKYRNVSSRLFEECSCTSCNLEKTEDLFHFIVECPRYELIRQLNIPFMTNL